MWWLVGILVFLIAIFVVYMLTSGLSDADKLIAARVATLTPKISTTAAEIKKQSGIAVDNADAATKNLAAAAFDKVAANATAASTAAGNATTGVVDLQDLMTQYQILAIQMTDLKTKATYNLDIAAKNKIVTQAQSDARAASDAAADAQKTKTAADNTTVSVSTPSVAGATSGGLAPGGLAPGATSGATSSNASGAASGGLASGATSGNASGATSGNASGATSGNASGATSGTASGAASGANSGASQLQLTEDEKILLSNLSDDDNAKADLVNLSISDQKNVAQLIKTVLPIGKLIDIIKKFDAQISEIHQAAYDDIRKNYIYTNLVNYSNSINSISGYIEGNITDLKSRISSFISLSPSFKTNILSARLFDDVVSQMNKFTSDTNGSDDSANSILLRSQIYKTDVANLVARSAIANKFQKNYIRGGTKLNALPPQMDELSCQEAFLKLYPTPNPVAGVIAPTTASFGFGYTFEPSSGKCNAIVADKKVRSNMRYRADPNDPAGLLYGADGYNIPGYDLQQWQDGTMNCNSHCTTPECAWLNVIDNGSIGPKNITCYTKRLASTGASYDDYLYLPDQAISRMRTDLTPVV